VKHHHIDKIKDQRITRKDGVGYSGTEVIVLVAEGLYNYYFIRDDGRYMAKVNLSELGVIDAINDLEEELGVGV